MIDVAVVDAQVLPGHAATVSLRRGQHLAVEHGEPAVGRGRPGAPGRPPSPRARRGWRGRAPRPGRRARCSVTRSAQSPPHHARSSSVAKHQAVADASTAANPASRHQWRRWLPASGSPPLASATAQYTLEPPVERGRRRVPAHGPVDASPAPRPRPSGGTPAASRGARPPDRRGAGAPGGRARRRTSRRRGRARTRRRCASSRFVDAGLVGRRRARRRWRRPRRRCRRTRPGATRCARSIVIVPGPHPTSSRSTPGRRWGRR